MYNIPQHEFAELKDYFDKNDCYNGTTKLSQIVNDAIEMAFRPDSCGQNYQQPLVATEGLVMETSTNSWETPGIGLDPILLESIANMGKEIESLRETVNKLESMHTPDSDTEHTPTIISTKEQWEEMKPEMDEKERVLVHTTFDKALTAL